MSFEDRVIAWIRKNTERAAFFRNLFMKEVYNKELESDPYRHCQEVLNAMGIQPKDHKELHSHCEEIIDVFCASDEEYYGIFKDQ